MNAYVCMKQVGEKRNMSALEKKVDALLLYCTADTEEEKEIYYKGLCRLVLGPYPEAQHSRRMQIDRFLKDMGIRDNLLGYEYLQTAIELALEDPNKIHRLTTVLYADVARRHDTHPQLVERSIRHAIETGWRRCDLEMQQQYFGETVDSIRCKPTNGAFIARVCNLIEAQYI